MKRMADSIPRSEAYQQEVIRRNCTNFRIFAIGGVIITGLILLVGIVLGNRIRFVSEYLFFFLYMVLLYAVASFCRQKQPHCMAGILYVVLLPIYTVAILMGTVFDAERPAITIMVLLCGLTLLITDNPVRLLAYLFGIAMIFSITAYFTKPEEVFITDMINLLIYGGISIGINFISLKERIKSVETYLMMQESRKQQERIIANLPTGIIVFEVKDHLYSIVQVNPAICKIMHFDSEKALKIKGERILKLIHPEDIHIVKEAAIKLIVPETEVHYEFRTKNRENNTYSWMAADGRSVAQSDGRLLVYISYADVNSRREQEEEYKRRIRVLAEMDDDTLIAKGQHNLTQNKVLLYASKREYSAGVQVQGSYDDAVMALAAVPVTKEKQDEIIHKTSRENLINCFRQGITDGMIEFRRRALNGQTRWTSVRYSLFEEPATGDVMVFMYSYDITERVTERKMVARFGSMEYDLFGLLDVCTGRYTMLNQMNHMQKLLTQEGVFEDIAQKRLAKLPDQEEQNVLLQSFTVANMVAALKDKELCSMIYSVTSEDGKLLRKRFRFIYLDDTEETIMFFRNDITEMYEKEQEQLREIEEALNAAKVASSAKTQFFSRMSHDMRTPMNGILGLAELSRDEEDKAVLKKNIEKIRESGQYLLGLINDTLDFQRIESGKLSLEPQIVNAAEIVENIVDMVRQTAQSKGVTLVVDKEMMKQDLYIKTDPLRLKQIFVNLLSNAVKFTPSGGMVEFSVKEIGYEKEKRSCEITVRDTGIGMSEEFLTSRIFQPFSQESNRVTAQYAGSGLGLSIAKKLVEMMDGRIEVSSELGTGTTFTVHLAFEQADGQNTQQLSQNDKTHTMDISKKLAGSTILLVEDHPLNAEIAMRLLKKIGCQVDWLQNGLEAVEYFRNKKEHRYDVVLMDIRMPIMDGLEATRQIRALDDVYAKTIPIIAMTANAYEEDIQHSLDAGMNAHLSKPVEPEKLYAIVAEMLDRKARNA